MSFTTQPLGQLKRIDAREVWKHEALHFTPWLKAHIELLGDALGIELELPETEVAVGEFSCDVVAVDASTRHEVVIENQLAQTDHSHLGQAITYAAGRDARTVVWISPEFREPHRQALDWLNANTGEGLDFFAVEVELLQIDDSAPAVHFKVVAQPNTWQQGIKQSKTSQVSEKGLLYQQFWTDLQATCRQRHPDHPNRIKTSTWSWIRAANAEQNGFAYGTGFTSKGQLKVEFFFDVGDKATNKAAFDALESSRADIEASVGEPLSWERLDHAKSSRIVAYRDALATDVDPSRQAHIEWAADMLGKLRNAFTAPLNALPLDALAAAAAGDGLAPPTPDDE